MCEHVHMNVINEMIYKADLETNLKYRVRKQECIFKN